MLAALLTVIAISQGGTPVATPAVGEPVLEIALRSYRADGRAVGSASTGVTDRSADYLSASRSLCSLRAGSYEPPDVPGIGWRVSGRVLQRTGDDFLVEINRERVWDRGERLPGGSVQPMPITLHFGDPLVLETVTPTGGESCEIAMARLEATITTKKIWSRGGGGVGGNGIAAAAPARGALDVDIWLVHQLPTGREEVQRVSASAGPGATPFAFPSMTLSSARGPVQVIVTGQVHQLSTGLIVSIDRHITADGPPPVNLHGGSAKRLPIPAPDDVISFELPPPAGPERELLAGHQFSLRFRITPTRR